MLATLPLSTVSNDLVPHRRAVEHRLGKLRGRVRGQLLVEGVAWTLGVAMLLAAASLGTDWWFRFNLATRLLLAPVGAAIVLGVAYRRLVRPLAVRLADVELAALLERRLPGVAQRVATVIQLPQLLDDHAGASPSMVRAAVLEQAAALERTDFPSVLDTRRHWRFLGLLVAAVLLPAGFATGWRDTAALWTQRWLFGSNVRWPQATYLAVAGVHGDRLLAPRGEPLVLQVVARSDSRTVPDQVSLRYWSPGASARRANFTRFGDNDFRYELPPIHESVEFTVVGGDDWLGPIAIEPIDRPVIKQWSLQARRPGRSDWETHSFEGGDAQLLFLRKTELELQVTSSMPLDQATLKATTGDAPPLERLDAQTFAARWTMLEPLGLELQLQADPRAGGLRSKPYGFTIGLLKDREPRVTIRSTGVGPRVTAVARIPLTLRATDDFGLTELALESQRTAPAGSEPAAPDEPGRVALDPPAAQATEDERQPELNLRDLVCPAGTTVKLRGTAMDNCAEGGQTGTSRWLTFRVVTPEELFHEILMRQRAERAKFRAALATAKSLAEPLDTAAEPDALDGVLRKHQVVQRQVWQVAQRLDESLTEMKLNSLGSPQAIELLQTQVITPVRQLHNEPMTNLRKLLDRMAADRTSVEPLLPDARDLHKEIVETMQRILDQMSQWESFVDVVNQLREIMKQQGKVLDSTEEERKKRTKGVFDE